jgi:epoxide hydrolase-like predicted phosphatase
MHDNQRHQALVTDFGGVLTTNIWESFSAFCVDAGLDEDTVKSLFREDPESLADLRELETGRVTVEEFERRFGPRLGIARSEGLVERLFARIAPDTQMIEVVRAIRESGVPVGLVSNSWGGTTYDQKLFDELFDAVVISGEVGLHKPEPEIYRLAADQLGIPPQLCVFVDDLRENCAGAEEVGMTAILHRDTQETIARLRELFELPSPEAV